MTGPQGMGPLGGLKEASPFLLDIAIMDLVPLAFWKLNDIAGSVATDFSGNGRHGVYNGGYNLQGEVGLDGRAFVEFDATEVGSGVIVLGYDSLWGWQASGLGISWLVMAKPTGPVGLQSPTFIACCGTTASNKNWRMRAFNFEQVGVSTYTSGVSTARQTMHSTDNLLENTWSSFIGRIPPDTSPVQSMVNWVSTTPGNTGTGSDVAGPLRIAHGFADGDKMSGAFALVAVWPYFLSSENILSLQTAAQADGWV